MNRVACEWPPRCKRNPLGTIDLKRIGTGGRFRTSDTLGRGRLPAGGGHAPSDALLDAWEQWPSTVSRKRLRHRPSGYFEYAPAGRYRDVTSYIHCTQVHHDVTSGGILVMTAICIVFVVKWTQPKHAGATSCRCSAHACPSRLSRGRPSKARLARGTQMVRQLMMIHLRAPELAKKRSCTDSHST